MRSTSTKLAAACTALTLCATLAFASGQMAGMGTLYFVEAAAPGTPASGTVALYALTDGTLEYKDDTGTTTAVGGGGGVSWPLTMEGDQIPDTDGAYDLGSSTYALSYVYTDNIDVPFGGSVLIRAGGTSKIGIQGGGVSFYDTVSFGSNTNTGGKAYVEDSTAVAASPHSVNDDDDNHRYFTNTGATAENVHNLPTADAGVIQTYVVTDSDGIQINVGTGDSIRVAGSVCTTGTGNVESATVGNTITLLAVNATEWIAVSYVGTWTVN